jgi:hypothetical protein
VENLFLKYKPFGVVITAIPPGAIEMASNLPS